MKTEIVRVVGEGVVFIGFWEMQNLLWPATYTWHDCAFMICVGALAVIAAELLR